MWEWTSQVSRITPGRLTGRRVTVVEGASAPPMNLGALVMVAGEPLPPYIQRSPEIRERFADGVRRHP